MTSPYVTFPPQPTPTAQSSGWPVVRAVLALLSLLCCVPVALFAAFWAAVEWSGCFMSCDTPNRGGGFMGAVIAVVALAAGPVAIAGLYRSRVWLWIAAGTAVVGSMLMVGVLGSAG
ncbi:MAG: hypothetical protein QOE05_2804 [Actinomycetota bacterium]|jgi:hypothetical protein|nr:hypothetical protein [Actinomycetota bacterium]